MNHHIRFSREEAAQLFADAVAEKVPGVDTQKPMNVEFILYRDDDKNDLCIEVECSMKDETDAT